LCIRSFAWASCRRAISSCGCCGVYLRSDTAAYQQELLLYCGEGKDPRFGVIEFAVGADVTPDFRRAVLALPAAAWRPLYRRLDGRLQDTVGRGLLRAELGRAQWAGHSRNRADYRFLAIREPLDQLDLGDADQLPFPSEVLAGKGRTKLFGLVTNRDLPGDPVIWWYRERSGRERGSPCGTEARFSRRQAAVGPVRGQCRVVGDHGFGA
jgi:hypothetical protein